MADPFLERGGELALAGPRLVDMLEILLDKGIPVRFQARGFSMSPFIRNEDVVTVSPLQARSPALGDVVAFGNRDTRRLIVHRVVGKKRGAYLIKGDNTIEPDGYATRESILGLVTRVERDGKNVSLGLGPERFLIALLGRRRLLLPLLLPVWRMVRPLFRRSAT